MTLWQWVLALAWPVPPEGFSLKLDSTVFPIVVARLTHTVKRKALIRQGDSSVNPV